MNLSHTFSFPSTHGAAAATTTAAAGNGDVRTLRAGQAASLSPRAPIALRVAEGQAWVTLDAGPYGSGPEAGDVFLHAGQTLHIAAGQHAVVEPVGSQRLQYRTVAAATSAAVAESPAPWWRRAAFGSDAAADQRVAGGACCA